MSEIQNNTKVVTVGYLSKVLTPIVTVMKSIETRIMKVFSIPVGGTPGQVLSKKTDVDGEVEWVDLSVDGVMDEQPTQDSENAVKSGGVYAALQDKQDVLVGTAGQIVGFDADGKAIAQDAAATALPVGVEGQYIGYDVDGNPVAADMPVNHLTREVVDVLPASADAAETVIYVLKVEDVDTGDVSYEEYQLVDGAMVRMSGAPVGLSGKQDVLTGTELQYVGFDADGKAVAIDLPDGHLTREVLDALPGADVAFEDVIYILKVADAADPTKITYQQWQLVDGEMVMIGGEAVDLPTDHLAYEIVDVLPDVADAVEGKLYILRITDAVTGDVTYQEYKLLDGAMVMCSADLSNVQTRLVGTETQYVGFDAAGNAVAIDLPTGHLTREVVDALPLVDDASEDIVYILKVVDPDDASVTYEQWQLIEGAFAQVGGAPVELPENHLTREVVDVLPLAADAKETVMYVLRTTDVDTGAVTYTEHQLIDGEMVQTSADLSGYQVKLTGTHGQMIVIDANGDAVAQDFPEGMLTREVVDTLPDVADAEDNVTYILKNDDGAGNITYSEWQLIDGELVQVGGEVTDMSAYQQKLVGVEGQYVGFDADGKAVALDAPVNHLTREVVDALPVEADASETVIYVLKVTDPGTGLVTGYQEWVLIDGAFVQTSGAAADLSGYQEKLVGTEGQHVVFDVNGDLVAADMPAGHLTREVVDALPAVDAASEDVIYILKIEDVDAGTVTYEEHIFVDGAFVKTSNEATDVTGKQDVLSGLETQYVGFDADGKAIAKDFPIGHLTREVVTALPAVDAASEDAVYILKTEDLAAGTVTYEEYILVDGAFVKTSNEAADLSGYQAKIVGAEGQHVVFDAAGELIAADMPEGHLKREVVDALPGVDVAAEDVVYILKVTDPDTMAVSYEEWIFVEGAFVQTSGAAVDMSGKLDTVTGTEGQYIGFDADGKAVAKNVSEIVDEAKTYTDEQINLAAHLKREIVAVDPTTLVDTNEHTIYMFKVDGAAGADVYQEWMLIDGAMTLIGDTSTTIDLTGKQDALTGTEGQLVGFDIDGKAVAVTPDAAPTQDSQLPITSGAVYAALNGFDALPAGIEGQVVGYDAAGTAVAIDLPTDHMTTIVVEALPDVADADATVLYVLKETDAGTGDVSYVHYQLIDGELRVVGSAGADIVLDTVPTENSVNGIESGAVYTALQGKMDAVTGAAGQVIGFDADGNPVAQAAAAASFPVGTDGQVVGYDADGNVVAMDVPGAAMDSAPTKDSTNGVTSGGVYTALQNRFIKTTGGIELNENGNLTTAGGYIDFHYAGSADDYSSRIIEGKDGVISMQCDEVQTDTVVANKNLYLYKNGSKHQALATGVHTGSEMSGFTAKSTQTVADFCVAMYTRYGNAYTNSVIWSNAGAISVTDGTTTVNIGGGYISCRGSGTIDNPNTWSAYTVEYTPYTGSAHYKIYISASGAGTYTSGIVTYSSASNATVTQTTTTVVQELVIPSTKPETLQVGSIWLS